jgi:DNA repair exonuclease SbcCD ATPase subunit
VLFRSIKSKESKKSIFSKEIESLEIKEKDLRITLSEISSEKNRKISKNISEERSKTELIISNIKLKFASDLEESSQIKEGLLEIKNEFLEKKSKLVDSQNEQKVARVKLEAQLKETIECPKCSFEFSLSSNESIEDIRNKINNFNSEIEKIESKISKNSEDTLKISQEIKEIESIVEMLNSQRTIEIESENKELEKKIDNITKSISVEYENKSKELSDTLEKLLLNIQNNKSSIVVLESENRNVALLIESNNRSIIELEKELKNILENEIEKQKEEILKKLNIKKSEVSSIQKEIENYLIWELRFKKFKSYLSNLSLANINDMTNDFLKRLGSNLEIEIDGYKELSSGKIKEEITCKVVRDGYITSSYGRYSSGERGRIDIATILSLQTLININSDSGGLDLLVVDEVLDSVDSLGITSIISSLVSLQKNILLVSQNDINYQDSILIRKQNRISQII